MSWQSLDHSTPMARKDHECQLCEWVIPAGSVYVKHVGIWEGDFWTYRAHLICDAVHTEIDDGTSADEGTPDPHGFRQLLAHVVSLHMAPNQTGSGLHPVLEVADELGFFDWDSWSHPFNLPNCPRCEAA